MRFIVATSTYFDILRHFLAAIQHHENTLENYNLLYLNKCIVERVEEIWRHLDSGITHTHLYNLGILSIKSRISIQKGRF